MLRAQLRALELNPSDPKQLDRLGAMLNARAMRLPLKTRRRIERLVTLSGMGADIRGMRSAIELLEKAGITD